MTKKRFNSNCKLGLVDGEEPKIKCLLDNGEFKSVNEWISLLNKLNEENKELKFKLEESNTDKEYVKQVIKDRIKHYHSYSCINKTDIDNGCIGLKRELEDFYNDVEPYLEELK